MCEVGMRFLRCMPLPQQQKLACLACIPTRPSRQRHGLGGTPGWLPLLQRLLQCPQVEHQPCVGGAPLPPARAHAGTAPAAPRGARLDDSCRWGSSCLIRQPSAKLFLLRLLSSCLVPFLLPPPLRPAAPVTAGSHPPALATPLGTAAAPAKTTGHAAAAAAATGPRGGVSATTLPRGPSGTAAPAAAAAAGLVLHLLHRHSLKL
jgi:hypothetical protein